MSKISLLENRASLIFVGSKNERVLPESQGIALYKAMRSMKLSPTSLYHYPSEGHDFKKLESNHHFLMKSITWIHKYLGTFDAQCTIEPPTTTTTTSDPSDVTTAKPPTTIQSGATSIEYFNAFLVLLSMQFFTLKVWYELRF